MTELERELSATLEIQKQLFVQELEKITESQRKSWTTLRKSYEAKLNAQNEIIEKQAETLKKYEKLSESVQVKLDEQPLNDLGKKLESLEERLTSLEKQLKTLNGVLKASDEELDEEAGLLKNELEKSEKNLRALFLLLDGKSNE